MKKYFKKLSENSEKSIDKVFEKWYSIYEPRGTPHSTLKIKTILFILYLDEIHYFDIIMIWTDKDTNEYTLSWWEGEQLRELDIFICRM